MADFKTRVEKYAALHKDLAKGAAAQKEDTNPAQINATIPGTFTASTPM